MCVPPWYEHQGVRLMRVCLPGVISQVLLYRCQRPCAPTERTCDRSDTLASVRVCWSPRAISVNLGRSGHTLPEMLGQDGRVLSIVPHL